MNQLALGLLLLASAVSCFAQDVSRMKQLVAAQTSDDRFMGAVLVARHDQPLFDQAVGWADVEWQVANTTDTKFRLGSVTKQFTAAAILGDHLTTQLSHQPAFPIFPESETKFFLKVVDAQVEFFPDASGKVAHLVMCQNGGQHAAQRINDAVP